MADNVDASTRSRMMSGIKRRDTKPELVLRRGLQQLGFRHRLGENYRSDGSLLPGKPDLVYPKYRAVVQVNGCFWHRHNCHLFRWPSTREPFWREKLTGNASRDARNIKKLEEDGWRVLVVWECSLKGRTRRSCAEVVNTAGNWLQFDLASAEIDGKQSPA
jgi:DNA mismatch endonuclease (patch repair protein)